MKLTRSTDYALRILVHLADTNCPQTMKRMASELDIPYNQMMKLVQRLAKRDILITRQGKGGGIQVARDVSNITVKDIVDIIDGPVELAICTDRHDSCSRSSRCQIRSVFCELQDKINRLFSSVSIKSISEKTFNLPELVK